MAQKPRAATEQRTRTGPTLLEQAAEILTGLAKGGWSHVFSQHGLDITPANLREELLRPLANIDRDRPGFEDFSAHGIRAIEPGRPAESLLFHGLASPNVLGYRSRGKEKRVATFPSPGDLEVIENLVYGITPPTVDELRVAAQSAPLAIVVFAKEYRSAINTVHRKHADMCYARTGVARVGTADPEYTAEARGYLPFDKDNGSAFRVLPCRYAAYVAALVPGDQVTHGPMRFIAPRPAPAASGPSTDKVAGLVDSGGAAASDPGDATRRFWVPIHKLFGGAECIAGYDLDVGYSAHHVNEKLRRSHLLFGKIGHDGGWQEPDISKPPFIFTEAIAELSEDPKDGPGLVVPVVHDAMVAIAEYHGKPLTYVVPNSERRGQGNFVFESTLGLRSERSGARSAPEYLHARYAVDYNGQAEQDLNELEEVAEIVRKGGYRAKHVIDFTGDGWIDIVCSELTLEIPHRLPAFSLVATPDFYPGLKQRDLMQWWEQSVPTSIRDTIWPQNPGSPEVLSDQRLAANLGLDGPEFDPKDDTMTAIVGHWNTRVDLGSRVLAPRNRRSSMLPDGAAGVFAPGWDVSFDQKLVRPTRDAEASLVSFFATHGLGSPFPEDTKLCAALSSYWPAAAPDITRTFQPSARYATATPLLDETIGQGEAAPWDGIAGPRIIDAERKIIEYNDIKYGDYVTTCLENAFDLSAISEMTPREYLARTVAMARAYQSLGATKTEDKVRYRVFSFDRADPSGDAELRAAVEESGGRLSPSSAYRFEIFEPRPVADEAGKPFNKVWVGFEKMITLYADAITVLLKDKDGKWTARRFRD